MVLIPVLAAAAVATVGGLSLFAMPQDGFSWSPTPSESVPEAVFVSDDQAFFEIPSSVPEDQSFPVYYVSKITKDDLPSDFSFDASKFPSHGPGWAGVYETLYVVREGLLSASEGSTANSAWLACYFQLGFGTSGYYPVYSQSGDLWTFPVTEFPTILGSISGENVGWLYNFGEFLVGNATFFADIFDFEIFGHKFIYLIASSAIFVYMGWCVVKFAVGL